MMLETEMNENITFDVEKFKDLAHFVIHHVQENLDADSLGNVKLHKILYFSDFMSYLSTMKPLTGADYQRQKFGPTAKYLSAAVRQLVTEGRIEVTEAPYFGYVKKSYGALKPPWTNRLSPQEQALIVQVVEFVCGRSAAEISELSHDEVWSSVPMGARIPYYASFALVPAEVTDEDVQQAVRDVERLAPVIEAEQHACKSV